MWNLAAIGEMMKQITAKTLNIHWQRKTAVVTELIFADDMAILANIERNIFFNLELLNQNKNGNKQRKNEDHNNSSRNQNIQNTVKRKSNRSSQKVLKSKVNYLQQ